MFKDHYCIIFSDMGTKKGGVMIIGEQFPGSGLGGEFPNKKILLWTRFQ